MNNVKTRAIFIDKDGTLIPDLPYNVDPLKIILEAGVHNSLRLFKQNKYLIVIISNQAGIALGYFEQSALKGVRKKIEDLLLPGDISLDGFYYCPHHPQGIIKEFAVECQCRKPRPGMILTAAADLNIDLEQSWMIGDILNDTEAGNTAGCRTVLINNGNETEWHMTPERKPDYVARDMEDAAGFIIKQTSSDVKELVGL